MSPWWLSLVAIVGAFLLGGVPFGVLVAKSRGVDLRRVGSGNIGATNVGRALGKPFAVLVFGLDAGKGVLGVLLADALDQPEWTLIVCGLAAVSGHMASPFLGFRGGKGVATGAGVFAMLHPWGMLAALVAWVATLWGSRMVAAASLAAAWVLPAACLGLPWTGWVEHERRWVVLLALALTVLITVRHRSNIGRIARGDEPKIGRSSARSASS